MNKALAETIMLNTQKLKNSGGIFYIDTYNHSIYTNGLVGTILTGVSFRNKQFLGEIMEEKIAIKNATKQGYLLGENGDGVDISGRMATHRGTVPFGLCQTLKANPDTGVITNDNYINKTLRIRKLTPCECIKLMGFEEDDYKSMKEYGLSDSAIYHCAGDSIVSTCIMSLLASMFEKDHREIVNNYVDNLVKE